MPIYLGKDKISSGGGGVSIEEITPEAIGALPETTTPADIGALPDSTTPGDIGALPTSEKGVANGVATLDENGKIPAIQAQSIRVQKTASHTLELSDAGKMIPMNASTALTLTIPTHDSVALPLDTEIEVVQMGTGAVTITAQSGVTLYSLDGATKIAGRFGVVSLKQIATNYWLLAGALA